MGCFVLPLLRALTLFWGLLTVQFLIAYSMLKQRGKAWSFYYASDINSRLPLKLCLERRIRVWNVAHFDRITAFEALYRSYALHRYSCIYETCMSPTLNGSSAIQHLKHSNVIELRDRIIFDFYTGLPQMCFFGWASPPFCQSPWPSTSAFTYCNWSKTGWWEGPG